jgi:hypothetical protein
MERGKKMTVIDEERLKVMESDRDRLRVMKSDGERKEKRAERRMING